MERRAEKQIKRWVNTEKDPKYRSASLDSHVESREAQCIDCINGPC